MYFGRRRHDGYSVILVVPFGFTEPSLAWKFNLIKLWNAFQCCKIYHWGWQYALVFSMMLFIKIKSVQLFWYTWFTTFRRQTVVMFREKSLPYGSMLILRKFIAVHLFNFFDRYDPFFFDSRSLSLFDMYLTPLNITH